MKSIVMIMMIALASTKTTSAATEFDSNGGSCMPGDPAIYNSLYTVPGGLITFYSTKIGLITVYCPIITDISAPSHVELTYLSSANDGSTYVTASYIKMDKTTGAITTISTASSINGVNDGTVQLVTSNFSDAYNTANYVYYVRVDLNRASSTRTVRLYKAAVY